MQNQRQPQSDRSLESLETRLRTLPVLPVPNDLEARLLAAIPPEISYKMTRPWRALQIRPRAVWVCAAFALAAGIVMAVRLWPAAGNEITGISVVEQPVEKNSTQEVTPQGQEYSPRITPSLEFRRGIDTAEMSTFTWPVQEKSPLMVSSAIPHELLD
jgi:hypothetical protein